MHGVEGMSVGQGRGTGFDQDFGGIGLGFVGVLFRVRFSRSTAFSPLELAPDGERGDGDQSGGQASDGDLHPQSFATLLEFDRSAARFRQGVHVGVDPQIDGVRTLSHASASASSAGSSRPLSPRPSRTHSSALATRRRRVFSALRRDSTHSRDGGPADDQHLVRDVHAAARAPRRGWGSAGDWRSDCWSNSSKALGSSVSARRSSTPSWRRVSGRPSPNWIEAQEDPPGDPLLVGRQGGEGGVGLGGHRHGQAAAAVAAEGRRTRLASGAGPTSCPRGARAPPGASAATRARRPRRRAGARPAPLRGRRPPPRPA